MLPAPLGVPRGVLDRGHGTRDRGKERRRPGSEHGSPSPRSTPTSVFPGRRVRASAIDSRAPVQSMVRVRTRTNSTESSSSLSSRTSRVRPRASGEPAAPTSMGLLVAERRVNVLRQAFAQRVRRTPARPGPRRPARRQRAPHPTGVAEHRHPPTIGQGLLVEQQRRLSEIVGVTARDDPAWAKSASTRTAGVAAAAVWEAPARWPLPERPPTTASSGLRSLKRRAMRANFAEFPKDSR